MRASAAAYVGLVIALGAVAACWALVLAPSPRPDLLSLALVVLSVLFATSTIPLPGTGVRLNADTPFLLALALAGQPRWAVLLSGVDMAMATVVAGTAARRPKMLPFNAGAGMIGALAAWVVIDGLRAAPGPIGAIAGALAMWAANTAVVVGAIRASTGRDVDAGTREGLLVSAVGYLGSGSVAWLLGSVPDGWASGLVATPLVGLVWLAWKSHSGRAEERQERKRERNELFLPALEALVAAIEARDEKTHGHNRRVRGYALGLARAVGLEDESLLTALGYGALLHDVGKIAIPDALLHAPRALNAEEIERVRRHAAIGSDLIRHVPFPPGVVDIVRHHHERWDGRGYPDGLAGEAIPLGARLVAVGEAYDDLRTGGGWRAPLSHEEALDKLEGEAPGAFDPKLIRAFLRWQREAPASEEERGRWSAANAAIQESSHEQARLYELAFRDELTGLANGRALRRDLAALIARGPVAVLMLDLDGFKGINDHFGHAVGDDALRVVGRGLRDVETTERRAYRNGGDEFVVLVDGASPADVARHAVEVREALEGGRIDVPGGYVPLRVSVGGTWAASGDVDGLLHAADEAMYAVKQTRRDARPRGSRPEVIPREMAG